MLFTYKALQKDGTKISGEMDASSEKEISEYLKKNSYFPIEIKEKNRALWTT